MEEKIDGYNLAIQPLLEGELYDRSSLNRIVVMKKGRRGGIGRRSGEEEEGEDGE